MKINFKKLAMAAGVTAAMAGSMSAHAVITAVPAPAQLVPLFYWNQDSSFKTTWDTEVRITVPKAVGADSVIALLAGQRNGSTNIALDTAWNTPTAAFKPIVADGYTTLVNEIHWYWLNNRSEEIANDTITVTPDDTVWFSARALSEGLKIDGVATNAGGAPAGQAGYLVLANQSADAGGAPEFAFAADAWVETTSDLYPKAFSIPVLGLADDVDETTYVTPTNNLIQIGNPAVVASPIHTGIRTSSTVAGFDYRVVDVPIHSTTYHTNTLVAWVDSNGDKDGLNNGADGNLWGIDKDEDEGSLGSFSLPNQLNIVRLGYDVPSNGPLGETIGINNAFTSCGKTCTGPKAAAAAQVASLPLGKAKNGGILKFVLNTKPLPNKGQGLAPGAYSSMIMFNVPGLLSRTGENDAPNMAIDTGFFTKK